MSLNKPIFLFFVLQLIGNTLWGQQKIKDYVKEQTVQVKHLSISDTIFDDLAPLGKAIGDARIVALGEQMLRTIVHHFSIPSFFFFNAKNSSRRRAASMKSSSFAAFSICFCVWSISLSISLALM